jgi:glycosyltransferase involved in cell wall biosynthesis
MRLLLSRAAAVVALWDGAKRELVELGVDPDSIAVIPHAVPAWRFELVTSDVRNASRKRIGVTHDQSVVGFVGALSREKRVDEIISAIASVPQAVLLIVGRGPERAGLTALANEVAPGRVRFFESRKEPATVMAACDVIVLASETEGMPGVLIEAGLMGIPVVAPDVGGVSAIVQDGVTGRLIDGHQPWSLAGAIRQLLKTGAGMGPAARRHCIERFDLSVVAGAWSELIERVVPTSHGEFGSRMAAQVPLAEDRDDA